MRLKISDLSSIHDTKEFINEIEKTIKEFYRILKSGHYCAIVIGDTKRNKMYQSLA
jgi:ubiquinone/menaquinone biosynthesis C-methylase UbiE